MKPSDYRRSRPTAAPEARAGARRGATRSTRVPQTRAGAIRSSVTARRMQKRSHGRQTANPPRILKTGFLQRLPRGDLVFNKASRISNLMRTKTCQVAHGAQAAATAPATRRPSRLQPRMDPPACGWPRATPTATLPCRNPHRSDARPNGRSRRAKPLRSRSRASRARPLQGCADMPAVTTESGRECNGENSLATVGLPLVAGLGGLPFSSTRASPVRRRPTKGAPGHR